jgi:hypothetical protein
MASVKKSKQLVISRKKSENVVLIRAMTYITPYLLSILSTLLTALPKKEKKVQTNLELSSSRRNNQALLRQIKMMVSKKFRVLRWNFKRIHSKHKEAR